MDLERARSIFDTLEKGLYASDRDGRLTFLNAAGERLLGWAQGELLRRDVHEVIHFQRADGTVAAHYSPRLRTGSGHRRAGATAGLPAIHADVLGGHPPLEPHRVSSRPARAR